MAHGDIGRRCIRRAPGNTLVDGVVLHFSPMRLHQRHVLVAVVLVVESCALLLGYITLTLIMSSSPGVGLRTAFREAIVHQRRAWMQRFARVAPDAPVSGSASSTGPRSPRSASADRPSRQAASSTCFGLAPARRKIHRRIFPTSVPRLGRMETLFTVLIVVQFAVIVLHDWLEIPGWTHGHQVQSVVGRAQLRLATLVNAVFPGTAVALALYYWRKPRPEAVTYRAIYCAITALAAAIMWYLPPVRLQPAPQAALREDVCGHAADPAGAWRQSAAKPAARMLSPVVCGEPDTHRLDALCLRTAVRWAATTAPTVADAQAGRDLIRSGSCHCDLSSRR